MGKRTGVSHRPNRSPSSRATYFELSGWILIRGTGTASLSVILYDANRKSLAWDFGGRPIRHAEQWRQVRTRFMIRPTRRQLRRG